MGKYEPELKSARGHFNSNESNDRIDVNLIEKSTFYKKHAAEMVIVRDASIIFLYLFLLLSMVISLWLKLERGEFPFTVDFMTRVAYFKRHWGTPSIALFIAIVISLIIYFFRVKFLSFAEGKAGEKVEEGIERMGYIHKIKTK